MNTLIYYTKEDADFLSHTTAQYTKDLLDSQEIYRGEMPTDSPIIHFFESQLSALTAYKIYEEQEIPCCLGFIPFSGEWAVVVEDEDFFK
jgi:hypothetical protein